MEIEYRIRPVTRYIVTKYTYDDTQNKGGVEENGEYTNPDTAYQVAYALARADHIRLGYPIDDERIKYPKLPSEAASMPADANCEPPSEA